MTTSGNQWKQSSLLFQASGKSALESEKYAAKHLKQYGEGDIFILLGTSTSGKTSIMHQLMEEVPNSVGTSMDEYGPAHDADWIRDHAPELYAKMALAMEHSDIAYAVFAGEGDAVRWKENVSAEVLQNAKEALEQAREQVDSFPRIPFPVVESRMMDHIISESIKGKNVVFDIFDSNLFLERMIQKNFYAPLKRGLVYCPFIVPVWTSEEIKNAIPHAELVILDHCGHFPYIEQPSQFFTELNNFLDKIQNNHSRNTTKE